MAMDQDIRIGIVSTPRVGNTWVNYCLSDLMKLPTLGLHRHTDIDGIPLPPRLLLQIHAPFHDVSFHSFVSSNNISVITVSRHPLDVLISMLRFVQIQPNTLQWLDGKAGLDRLYGVNPSQKQFIEWCLGDGAADLLSITYDWARSGRASVVRYEDLLARPVQEMQRLIGGLGYKFKESEIETVLNKFDPNFFKTQANEHSWNASSGNWKSFFTKRDARKIFRRHKDIFDYFGYSVQGAQNNARQENLVDWDRHTSQSDIKDFLYSSAKELEIQAKRTLLDKINKEWEMIHGKHSLVGLQQKEEALRIAHEELAALRREIDSIVPLRKHLRHSLKRRIALADLKISKKQSDSTASSYD